MRPLVHRVVIAAVALVVAGHASGAGAQATRLSVVIGDSTHRLPAVAARARVTGPDSQLAAGLHWQSGRPGVETTTLELRAGSLGLRVQALVVRIDPSRVRFALQHRVEANAMTGTWTVDSAGPDALLAVNAGQFKETGPWGWLVLDGEEHRNPLRAPLAIGVRIDTAGRIRWVPPGRERSFRHDLGTAFAFQSFPLLLYDHQAPAVLRNPDAMRRGHRDTRLVLAELDDGRLLFALTRYVGLGTVAERVPIGLTTGETLVLAAALGARHAVMLDGGVSAQLLVRDGVGGELRRPGLRRVPLGIVAAPRVEH